jgi:hypothetical protein
MAPFYQIYFAYNDTINSMKTIQSFSSDTRYMQDTDSRDILVPSAGRSAGCP